MSSRRRRPRRRRWPLVLSLLAGFLGIGELIVRGLLPTLDERPLDDLLLGWTSLEYAEFAPETALADDERLRMLVLGDSYLTLNRYQHKGQDLRFPAQIERRHPDRIVTRTLATQGWGTDQELLAYLEKGRLWHPDLVVLAFCANNDLLNIMSTSHGRITKKPYFRVESDDSLRLYDPEGRVLSMHFRSRGQQPLLCSAFVSALQLLVSSWMGDAPARGAAVDPHYGQFDGKFDMRLRRIEQFVKKLDFSPQLTASEISAYVHEPGDAIRYQWALLERILRELRDQVEADGARLVVLLLPTTYKPRDLAFLPGGSVEHWVETPDGPFLFRAAEPAERLADICDRIGVDSLDVVPAFARIVAEGALHEQVWPDPVDRHYSAIGQRIVSRIVEDYLRDELGLL